MFAARIRRFYPLVGFVLYVALSACTREQEPTPASVSEPPASETSASAAADDCTLGVQLYSFRNELDRDLPGTLARIKELGIHCIEPYSLHGLTPEALRAEFDKAGLQVVSFHMPRDIFVGPPQDAVSIAKTLGAKQIGVAWIKESENDVVDEPKMMAAAERLNAMCSAAQAADMHVFYHTHGYEFHEGDPDGKLFDRFVNALTPGCVVLQLDVYWVAYAGQDPVQLLRRYADRTLSLHVKDMAASMPVAPFDGSKWSGPLGDESFAVVGQGKLDWPALLAAAKASSVRWYIIEDETSRPFENIAAGLPFLRSQGL
jgi:sugar phosphate isomerase/epimerase